MLGEFDQIYSIGAFGDKYKLIRFLGQRSRLKTDKYGERSTFADIF